MLNQPMQIERHVTGGMRPARPRALATDSTARGPSFSALEWLVIATAARDPKRSLCTFRMAPLLMALHGRDALDPSAPLAALASMAANSATFGRTAPPCEMAAFLRAGWTDSQLELLINTVERFTS